MAQASIAATTALTAGEKPRWIPLSCC